MAWIWHNSCAELFSRAGVVLRVFSGRVAWLAEGTKEGFCNYLHDLSENPILSKDTNNDPTLLSATERPYSPLNNVHAPYVCSDSSACLRVALE